MAPPFGGASRGQVAPDAGKQLGRWAIHPRLAMTFGQAQVGSGEAPFAIGAPVPDPPVGAQRRGAAARTARQWTPAPFGRGEVELDFAALAARLAHIPSPQKKTHGQCVPRPTGAFKKRFWKPHPMRSWVCSGLMSISLEG